MAYPKLVAFDLDGTIWSNWLNPKAIGLRGWVGPVREDNLEIFGNTIRDSCNLSKGVRVSSDIYYILDRLIFHGVRIAAVSKNPDQGLCDRAMWLIKMQIPRGSNYRPFTDFLSYSEVHAEVSKQYHFQRIRAISGIEYHQMLFFDDQAYNNEVEMWQGVTFHKVAYGNLGVTLDDYFAGLETWRRNQFIACPMPSAGPNPFPNVMQIGWVGTDKATGKLYKQGKRRPKSNRPSRWGWGMYVSDDPSIAAEFAKWGREREPENQYICQVFVRDFEVFRQMNKVWIPERGLVPKTHIDQGDEQIAEIQIRRDNIIANVFGVQKPYILFSRHHWMDFLSMTWRRNHVGRFSEMVIYPQIQDALFYGEPWKLSDAQQQIDAGRFRGFDFRHRLARNQWNIQWNGKTRRDFDNHDEDFC